MKKYNRSIIFSGLVYHRVLRILFAYLCVISWIMSIAILNWSTTQNFNFENDISILTMVDVGQGDGFILEMPTGQKIYIDIGEKYQTLKENRKVSGDTNFGGVTGTNMNGAINYALSAANSILGNFVFSRNTADLLFLTHDDADHAGALAEFASNERIGALGLSPFQYTYVKKLKNIPVSNLADLNNLEFFVRGMNINFGGQSDILQNSGMSVLYPDVQDIKSKNMSTSSRAVNPMSLIIKFNFGSTSILFTGDSGFDEEEYLVGLENGLSSSSHSRSKRYSLDSDILKVGHHGSKGSTDESFLNAVSPNIALISMGRDNKYGHPHSTVISKLQKIVSAVDSSNQSTATNIIRTDLCGTVRLYIYKNGAVGRRKCDSSLEI